jgi:FtsP/CotA-like multicopper oxidase with cupredoxin domain
MPTLTFTEGDTAEIHVHNRIKRKHSLHWHGLFLPNKEDGVPYLTQMPIEPNTTHVYTFPNYSKRNTLVSQSFRDLQEQIGMYGSMVVMLKKADDPTFRKGIDDLPTVPIILSEWTD